MKNLKCSIIAFLIAGLIPLCVGCNTNAKQTGVDIDSAQRNDKFYFDVSINGKEFHFTESDILTSYNEFSATDREFKIFVGKEDKGPNLTLTIIADMAKPSTTPNGTPESISKLAQGSVSLQDYPEKGLTFNSYDFLLNPKPAVIPGAIIISDSKIVGDKGRILTGTINVIVRGGAQKEPDPLLKDYVIKGKFNIMHEFKGRPF